MDSIGLTMSEKVFSLISGGIDSPLASLLVAKKFEIIPIYFCPYPISSKENSLTAFKTIKSLRDKAYFEKAIFFPWAWVLSEIKNKVRNRYSCLACRRSMLIAAEELRKQENVTGLVTGESLGQKASQTLENISATSSKIDLPIIRPLIGMNKDEIKKLSKEKGIWRSKHSGGCPGVPQKPRTKASVEELDREMEKTNLYEIIETKKKHMIEISEFERDIESYLSKLKNLYNPPN